MVDFMTDDQLQTVTFMNNAIPTMNCSYEAVSPSYAANMHSNDTNIEAESVTQNGYSSLFQIISVTVGVIIFTIGMLGNMLVVLVVCRTKSMHSPTNCYLISLSIADIIVLLSATLPSIPEPFFQKKEWPWGRVACSLLVFLQYCSVDASSLSITAFTVERYIAICHPMKAQRMCTVKRAKRIIAFIWAFSVLYCSPWLGLTHVVFHPKLKIEICDYRLDRNKYLAYYMTDLIAFYVLPLLIAAVLYTLIARILFLNSVHTPKAVHYNGNGKCRVQKTGKNSRKQVVRMLIVIVGVFATLWLPYRGMVVYNSFAKKRYVDIWFLLFCRMMVYMNSAINPILYNAMSVKFRRAFQKFLCCGIASTRQNSDRSDRSVASKASIQTNMRHACAIGENSCLILGQDSAKRRYVRTFSKSSNDESRNGTFV